MHDAEQNGLVRAARLRLCVALALALALGLGPALGLPESKIVGGRGLGFSRAEQAPGARRERAPLLFLQWFWLRRCWRTL